LRSSRGRETRADSEDQSDIEPFSSGHLSIPSLSFHQGLDDLGAGVDAEEVTRHVVKMFSPSLPVLRPVRLEQTRRLSLVIGYAVPNLNGSSDDCNRRDSRSGRPTT